MLSFLKILFSNFAKGPSTDSFPFKEARTPERFRGRVTMDSSRCVGCAICHHVCPGDAIRIEPNEEKTGYSFTIWHNSCALCGLCRHFCPTKAISMTNDWHNAHTQENKYDWAEHHFVPYLKC
ncbi:4Fe-4S binding protein, partial [Desulfovibrio sp. OttesenSCG-928-C14]|nr:4Fe-4S binding protein [Desulfovibrio sp. OttesenSCG-928-C14]